MGKNWKEAENHCFVKKTIAENHCFIKSFELQLSLKILMLFYYFSVNFSKNILTHKGY